jgi:hypothetical protein
MLNATQKDYVFRLAMEAAQSRAMAGDCKEGAVEAARSVVAAAKVATKALDSEDTITVNISVI